MTEEHATVPYWRLSSFYFWYFALLGALFPYWSLYLQDLGYAADAIGVLLAIPLATKIVAPSIWGWLADHTNRRLAIVQLGSALAAICFSAIFFTTSFWPLVLILAGYSFFWNAVLPQHEVITLGFLPHKPEHYSRIRVWGSIGFIIAVTLCGIGFERFGIGLLPYVGLLLLLSIWASSLFVPEPPLTLHRSASEHFLAVCRKPAVLAFLAGAFLLQLSHGVYYSFYSILMESVGYSRTSIGMLWSVGVVAEVAIFFIMHNLLTRVGVRLTLIVSLVIAVIRWLLIAHFSHLIAVLVLAQVFHAFTFGTFHAASIEAVRRLFDSAHQGKAQALYSGISFGAGGASGSLLGGYVWDYSPILAYDLAALSSLVAVFCFIFWLKDRRLN